MKNLNIPILFVLCTIVAVVGAVLKIEGSRTLGNSIMMFAAFLHLVVISLWIIRQRSRAKG